MKRIVCVAATATLGALVAMGGTRTDESAAEVMNVIRPGGADAPYWNKCARWFMYRPVIGFPAEKGATKYVFTVIDDYHRATTFEAQEPRAEFSEDLWKKLPVGYFTIRAVAETLAGAKEVGVRRYWKLAPFKPGTYPKPTVSYRDAARKAYDYAFEFSWMQNFLKTGKPDPEYRLNCYPSKMHSSLIHAMIRYARLRPERAADAMKLAHLAADYLLSIAERPDAPLAYFTPTYETDPVYKDKTAVEYAGQTMILYPAEGAMAFFDLYRATKEEKYKAAGVNIARTYLKLQGEDGTWTLKFWLKDGSAVCPNRAFPVVIVRMLGEAHTLTGEAAFRTAADRAIGYLDRHSFATFDWDGQFEDAKPAKDYEDLSHHPACDAAILVLGRHADDPARRFAARECVRFAEDQFTCWELPARGAGRDLHGIRTDDPCPWWDNNYHEWTTVPTVVEQYYYTAPVDASVAKMVRTYLAIYKVEKKPLDLEKAKAMADALVRAQLPSGRIPTIWTEPDLKNVQADWVNCLFASAAALTEIAEFLEGVGK